MHSDPKSSGYAVGTNRLASVTSPSGTRSFTPPASGHTASDDRGAGDVLHYAYDDGGRLVGVTRQGSPAATYEYDARGRRVQRTVLGSPNVTTAAIHRPDGRLIATHDGGTGTVLAETIRLDDGTPLALVTGLPGSAVIRYVHPDHLGTPRLLTDGTGAVVWDAAYQPFGELASMTGSGPDERFPGQHFDAETGLHQNHHRSYDPTIGRYLEPDPIGLAGGWNRYAYVGARPLRSIDPLGLDETNWWNTSGGRSFSDGPTNGNWGGKCWSGGRYSCGPNGMGDAAPTDSGDACYQRHDTCYTRCAIRDQACIRACDGTLVEELRALDNDPRRWPQPPRPGTEDDSRRYRDRAIGWFE